jgi:fluoride exporter
MPKRRRESIARCRQGTIRLLLAASLLAAGSSPSSIEAQNLLLLERRSTIFTLTTRRACSGKGAEGMKTELLLLMAWVALGAAAGGVARSVVSGLIARTLRETFPWGTMTVNVTGAFLIGVLSVLAENHAIFARPEAWPLAATGFLGSYTTVSSFSLQTLALARGGALGRAAVNVLLSLLLCLSAVAAGVMAASALGAGAPS